MIRTKVVRVVKIDNDREVFIWLENGKTLSCSVFDGNDFKLAFEVKVGDVICYEEKQSDKILVKSINK
ncbi:MAG: hypothetical protein IKW58_01060 [Alphaproteobacteria bacterium]|nr:hypothetical protein [Alphaproteobacteria bacterium]